MTVPVTLVLITENGKMLLGMKKRGFGAGYWNGFGGKLEKDESMEVAARREVMEEVGVELLDLIPRAVLTFTFEADEKVMVANIFHCTKISGTPQETEEMMPQWFEFKDIPLDKMWDDDKYWMAIFLAGNNFEGSFHFDLNKKVKNYNLTETK